MPSIGLLWDAVSNNMGDQAIGLTLQRAFARAAIPWRAIDPFRPDLRDIALLVVGGGELIRAPGDPFYDTFRARGTHILNTVGVLGAADTRYLDQYRMVSVRSQADRARLGCGEVVPCLTLLYEEYLPAAGDVPDIPAGAIGINLNFSFFRHVEPFVRWLAGAGLGPVVWLPITHYNADEQLLRAMAGSVPGSVVLPTLSPDAAFQAIGRLSALVSCSLHASLFAYAQGVPTMGYQRIGKLATFLRERGQEGAIFQTADDIARALPRLAGRAKPPPVAQRGQDSAACQAWLAQMIAEADRALSERAPAEAFHLTPANRRSHRRRMWLYRLTGEWAARLARRVLRGEWFARLVNGALLGVMSASRGLRKKQPEM